MSEQSAEGHSDAHGWGVSAQSTESTGSTSGKGRVDAWVEEIMNYVTHQINSFVAFLFLVFSAGALYGSVITERQYELGVWLLIAPAALGLMAYYSRRFALLIFAAIIFLFVIL